MSVEVSESSGDGAVSKMNLALLFYIIILKQVLAHLPPPLQDGLSGGKPASSYRTSLFLLCLLSGLGCGLVYAATLTITCQYFEKRRGLALGIVTTGSAAHPLSSGGVHVFHV